ncbi:hypothetical protein EDC90_103020 [Martelella mediterranea]|uniref:Uncharacterized protein n=1 Tax=Martelella mediterranea TaxID=293089 RepID=A0A4R3NRF6_9HYPH|nr:hypothetical protein EDC90_103020 [Martelella mediterranea]
MASAALERLGIESLVIVRRRMIMDRMVAASVSEGSSKEYLLYRFRDHCSGMRI